ncbi:MAG: chemotaxis response regulator protein-glutamate methylesterase [Nitrospirota bacterium]
MKKIRVLVVDDSPQNRKVLTGILGSSHDIEVIGAAADGEEAIERVVRLKPDLITLDLEMPRMDGFTFLRWLMRSVPTPVLVISSRADDRSVITALEFGAVDFLPKPVSPENLEELGPDLIEKARFFAGVEISRVSRSMDLLRQVGPASPPKKRQVPAGEGMDLVAIGASTGGPPAVQAILANLPKEFPSAIAVSQHMPPVFTRFFAERLDKLCTISVKEASEGDPLLPGTALIAPGGYHMSFKRTEGGVAATLKKAVDEDRFTPSVDAMMRSAALNFGKRTMGVILTGMGNDGREGMSLIRGLGGRTIAESQETAVIYGMPKEAVEAGAVEKSMPLDKIAAEILRICV